MPEYPPPVITVTPRGIAMPDILPPSDSGIVTVISGGETNGIASFIGLSDPFSRGKILPFATNTHMSFWRIYALISF